MAEARPQTSGTDHDLPFDQLSPTQFEKLCFWLLKEEGFPVVRHVGGAGADGGVDLEAVDAAGRLTIVQCKRYKPTNVFRKGDAEREVAKILERGPEGLPYRYLLILTQPMQASAWEALQGAAGTAFTVDYWDITALDERLRSAPPSVLERFFQLPDRGSRRYPSALVGLVSALALLSVLFLLPTEPDVYRLGVTVLDPDGAPVSEADVGSSVGGEVRQGDGLWELVIPRSSVPADGRIDVHAAEGSQRGTVEVILDADPRPALIVRLEPPPAMTIRGTVVDGRGRPVAEARVSVEGRAAVETDDDGTFELLGAAPEGKMVQVRVTASGFRVLEELLVVSDRAKRLELEEET